MSDQILDILKIAFLLLLYLFFVRVLWVVAAEVRSGRGPQAGQAPNAASMNPAPNPFLDSPARIAGGVVVESVGGVAPAAVPPLGGRAQRGRRGQVGRLFVVEPAARRGDTFPITHEITVGRSPGCTIQILDDTFISNLHCRIYRDEANNAVLEDLGSTNGTYLNGDRMVVPKPLRKGDRVQIGGTIVEAQ